MKVSIFLNTAVGHKRDYIENFGKGIEKIGKDEVVYNKDQAYHSTDVAVIFGFKSSSVESEIHLHRQEVFDNHKNGKIFFIVGFKKFFTLSFLTFLIANNLEVISSKKKLSLK